MSAALTIGDFSVMTHLRIKTLRYYHQVKLLEPAKIDPDTGYRYYQVEQIPTAQIIQRFRQLKMPVEEIKTMLAAPDVDKRNSLIANHLNRLEEELEQTRQAVTSLRNLLEPATLPISVEHRTVPATPAIGIEEVVELSELLVWYHGALGELYGCLAVQGLPPNGPSGGLFSRELFQYARGKATIFVPVAGQVQVAGRISPMIVPPAELAVTVHVGAHTSINATYGALGTYVAKHTLAVAGPVREYYLVDHRHTTDATQWRTEIGWPIFQTGNS